MRVLWFSNTPALGKDVLENGQKIKSTGGWLKSLNHLIESRVELHVAFHFPYKKDTFFYSNTTFHPLYTNNIYLSLLRKRIGLKLSEDFYIDLYRNLIDKVQPDLIHIHGTENFFLSIIESIDIPIIVSIQGNLTVYNQKFNSGFLGKYLNLNEFSSIKDFLIGPRSFKNSKIFFEEMSIYERKRMLNIRYIFGRTDWDYRITRVLSPKSQYFVGNELLRDSFYEHHWNNVYTQGSIRLFTTNGDSYYKGIETVFHCITLLIGLGIQVEWHIAGLNEKSLVVSICKKFLGQNFPKKGFKLMGSLDEFELVDELMKSHIYVMPSHIENSPNNLCEAMILGLPCVATFAGGTGSILKDGEEGILVQDGDPWAMTGAIIELMRDPDKANMYGTNARKRALKRHDKETVVQEYLTVYNSLI